MWLFRQDGAQWTVEVLPPAASDPEVGYAEFAGWIPGKACVLMVREARVDGRFKRRFEVVNMATLEVEKSADRPEALIPFSRWQDPIWKGQTLSVR